MKLNFSDLRPLLVLFALSIVLVPATVAHPVPHQLVVGVGTLVDSSGSCGAQVHLVGERAPQSDLWLFHVLVEEAGHTCGALGMDPVAGGNWDVDVGGCLEPHFCLTDPVGGPHVGWARTYKMSFGFDQRDFTGHVSLRVV